MQHLFTLRGLPGWFIGGSAVGLTLIRVWPVILHAQPRRLGLEWP
ncbi:MAG: hypothetical protein ACOZJZ_19030 [Pseudomonadota bacterium]